MSIELVHLTATATMTGLIWFVQVVHYPLFALVGESGYPTYQRSHERLTTFVVLPLMGAELVTAVLIVLANSEAGTTLPWVLSHGLLVLIWLSTLLVQVPCHQRLESGFDPTVHRRLVSTNWLRTVAWTTRSILLLVLLSR